MDKLEKYIHDHREEFDWAEPPAQAWGKIDSQLNKGRPGGRYIRFYLKIAAAIVVLAIVSAVIYMKIPGTDNRETAIQRVAPQVPELKKYYQDKIHAELVSLPKQYQNPEFLQYIQTVNVEANQLEDQLLQSPPSSRKQLIQAIILLYKNRLETLEQLQHSDEMYTDTLTTNVKAI